MAASKAEQVRGNRFGGSGAVRHQKQRLARARRRAEKRDPENAGKRVRDFILGYVD